jgi:hypothetical protein
MHCTTVDWTTPERNEDAHAQVAEFADVHVGERQALARAASRTRPGTSSLSAMLLPARQDERTSSVNNLIVSARDAGRKQAD